MNAKRKELLSQYKERAITGGVYAIKNTLTGKIYLESSTDINAARNRFDFSRRTGNCAYNNLREDWAASGAGSFEFETLEEIKKHGDQTDREFEADVAALKELWLEKSRAAG